MNGNIFFPDPLEPAVGITYIAKSVDVLRMQHPLSVIHVPTTNQRLGQGAFGTNSLAHLRHYEENTFITVIACQPVGAVPGYRRPVPV